MTACKQNLYRDHAHVATCVVPAGSEHDHEANLTHVPDGAHRTGEKLYKIRRFYRNDERSGEIVKRGLTLAQAQEHCQDESTHARDSHGVVWFDGYEEEG